MTFFPFALFEENNDIIFSSSGCEDKAERIIMVGLPTDSAGDDGQTSSEMMGGLGGRGSLK